MIGFVRKDVQVCCQ